MMFFMEFSLVTFSIIHLIIGSLILLIIKKSYNPYIPSFIISFITGIILFVINIYLINLNEQISGGNMVSLFNTPNPYYYFITYIVTFNIPFILFTFIRKKSTNQIPINKNQINPNAPENTIDKIGLTVVKDYGNIKSLMRIAIPFSIKLTNKAIYSYVFWIIPIGKILLKDIIDFKVIKNEMIGFAFFKQGIVIKSQENNEIQEIVFFVWKNKIDSFANNLKQLSVKENIQSP